MSTMATSTECRSPSASAEASQARLDSLRASEHPHCVICGAENPLGMRLKFKVQDDGSVVAVFPCRQVLQSYPETLHGGVISALLDAAMTNALFAVGVVAVTADLSVRFRAKTCLDRVVVIRAAVERSDCDPLFHMRSEMHQDGKLVASATARFVVKGAMGA